MSPHKVGEMLDELLAVFRVHHFEYIRFVDEFLCGRVSLNLEETGGELYQVLLWGRWSSGANREGSIT